MNVFVIMLVISRFLLIHLFYVRCNLCVSFCRSVMITPVFRSVPDILARACSLRWIVGLTCVCVRVRVFQIEQIGTSLNIASPGKKTVFTKLTAPSLLSSFWKYVCQPVGVLFFFSLSPFPLPNLKSNTCCLKKLLVWVTGSYLESRKGTFGLKQ